MTQLLLSRGRYRFHLSLSLVTTRDLENEQCLPSSLRHFSKYLKNCYYYFWYWFVLNLSREDTPRISICKLWWRSRSQQRLIGFFGNHKDSAGVLVHPPQHSTRPGGQTPPTEKDTIRHQQTQTQNQIFFTSKSLPRLTIMMKWKD